MAGIMSRIGGRLALAACLLAGASQAASAAEPPPNRTESGFTHRIVGEPEYYTTSPAQGRPPDGRLKQGTKVRLLREAGSYAQVRTEQGVTAYVSADALKKIEEAMPIEITDDARAVAQSSNRLAFDLYKQLREEEGNLFFSPASVSTALAMTYAGAAGQTEKQMAQVLRFDLPEPRVHAGYSALAQILNSRRSEYQLSMANRLWAQEGYRFERDFLAVTRERYGAELAQVDFGRQTEQARQKINAWVEDETAGKIVDLIPPDVLDATTRLVLTNAIYFKGAWKEEFSKSATQEAPFHVSPQRQVKSPLMRQTKDFRYAEEADLQILELPYAGGDLAMVVLLPRQADGLAALEGRLTAESAQKWTAALRSRKVQVFLPRFKSTSQFNLSKTLQSLGMELAFSEQADFSRMLTEERLAISEVIHKAFVDVNEEGTEAAAATGVVIKRTAAPVTDPPVVFRADHPFVFLIQDRRTGAVLFLGRVANPAADS